MQSTIPDHAANYQPKRATTDPCRGSRNRETREASKCDVASQIVAPAMASWGNDRRPQIQKMYAIEVPKACLRQPRGQSLGHKRRELSELSLPNPLSTSLS